MRFYHKNYIVTFKRDGKAFGVAEIARTKGEAISKALDRTEDVDIEDVINIVETFSAPF